MCFRGAPRKVGARRSLAPFGSLDQPDSGPRAGHSVEVAMPELRGQMSTVETHEPPTRDHFGMIGLSFAKI